MQRSLDMQRATIFVSIAAYRDPDTRNTVRDLFNKADHPHRIRVGVLSQIDLETEKGFLVGVDAFVDERVVDYRESKGAGWARSKIQTDLMGSEDFYLQIDAHSRFDYGWDSKLMQMFQETNDEKAIFTSYPAGFDPKQENMKAQTYTGFICVRFDYAGLPQLIMVPRALQGRKVPEATVFTAAGCLFSRTSAMREVPYDPYIYFLGEETSLAMRLFTHGYNLYLPYLPFMYHHYKEATPDSYHNQTYRGETNVSDLNARSIDRVRHLLGIQECSNPETIKELDKYKLGTVRSLRDWEIFAGLEISTQTVSQTAQEGTFPCPYRLF